jgi:membrane associated rhomboid family serine protease
MGLYDRGYYREENDRRSSWESAQARTYVIPLIVVNVAIFLLDAFTPANAIGGHLLSDAMALTSDTWRQPWNWWKFLTYGFAHSPLDSRAGIMHVGGNMLTLFFLGRPIEVALGSKRFLRIYLAAIIVSGLGWVLVSQLKGVPASVYGASGAVSAVVAMFIFKFPRSTLLLFGIVPIRAWVLGLIIVGMDLMNSFSAGSRIAGEAHLFGLAFGVACIQWNLQLGWLDWSRPWVFLSGLLSPRRKLRVHDPDSDGGTGDVLQDQADRILDKISREGESSLTRRERKLLERYSQQVRKRRDE